MAESSPDNNTVLAVLVYLPEQSYIEYLQHIPAYC